MKQNTGETKTTWFELVWSWSKKELNRLKLKRRGSFSHSSIISLLLQPFLSKEKAKFWLGAQLLGAVVFGGIAQVPDTELALGTWEAQQPISNILTYEISTPSGETEITFLVPVTNLTGISQYFHNGHPGLDMRAPLKSDVVSFDKGKVVKIVNSRFGYGRHVYVEHENGLKTLYAHLGLITVEEGESIIAGSKVGEVGLTGWTTGPHLHFEVYKENVPTNPIAYLKKSLASAN